MRNHLKSHLRFQIWFCSPTLRHGFRAPESDWQASRISLLLDVSLEISRTNLRPIYVACLIRRDTFRRGSIPRFKSLAGVHHRVGNEGRDFAILDTPDSDATPEPGIARHIRFRVRDIENVFLIDENT